MNVSKVRLVIVFFSHTNSLRRLLIFTFFAPHRLNAVTNPSPKGNPIPNPNYKADHNPNPIRGVVQNRVERSIFCYYWWRCELGLAIHIVKVKVILSDRVRVRVRLTKFTLLQ